MNPIIEAGARAICDKWGYLWDAPPEDDQATGTGETYDERPTKELYADAARAAYKAMVGAMTDEQCECITAALDPVCHYVNTGIEPELVKTALLAAMEDTP